MKKLNNLRQYSFHTEGSRFIYNAHQSTCCYMRTKLILYGLNVLQQRTTKTE